MVDGPEPGPRRWGHTTTMVGSELFVFGGQTPEELVNDMWKLNLNCRTFAYSTCDPF